MRLAMARGRSGPSATPPSMGTKPRVAPSIDTKRRAAAKSRGSRSSPEQSLSSWCLSHQARAALDRWGSTLCSKVQAARAPLFHSLGVRLSWPCERQLAVGTDCSGAEAPIWALRAMGVPHSHVFSCDINADVRSFIAATCPPTGPIFDDMLTRSRSDIPPHTLYVCGFPCKPFSTLRRHSTKFLREATARPFFEVLRVLREHSPKLVVLENVQGITAVLDRVLRHIRSVPGYFLWVVPIDSADLGEPVRRPRLYFVLVRQDCAVSKNLETLDTIVRELCRVAREGVKDHVSQRMLPSSSPAVKQFVEKLRADRQQKPRGVGSSGRPLVHAPMNIAGILLPRQLRVWAALKAKHPCGDLVADVSQSVQRAHGSCSGVAPTLMPGGVVILERAGRPIMAIEKLLLHGFPIHRMGMPTSTPNSVLSSLGGNTMHLKSVGLSLLLGISLIDWSSSIAQSTPPLARSSPAARFPLQLSGKRQHVHDQGKKSLHPTKQARHNS